MNGMKKLLGVIGILALAAAMLPAQGYADLRGGFAPLTTASGFPQGCEQSAHRPDDGSGTMLIPYGAGAGQADPRLDATWFSFSAHSLVPAHENVRSIYLHLNFQQSGYFVPLKHDPLVGAGGHTDESYFDPAWSYDGKYLAYIKQIGLASGLYVQQYFVSDDFEAVYGPGAGADSPIGDEFLVTDIGQPRHPSWSPSGYQIAFDSALGGTRDLYTADVDVVGHTPSTPTLITFDNLKAEENPSWGPNGDIVYTTNKYGPLVLEIVNVASAPTPGDPHVRLAELQFAFVTHNNPDWTSDGASLYYDAASSENPNNGASVWKLDLATQVKCEIQLDNRADADPDVSPYIQNTAADGTSGTYYSNFMFTTQAGNLGLAIWRGNPVNSCLTPLPMIVTLTPSNVNYKSHNPTPFVTKLKYVPEATAAHYQARSTDNTYTTAQVAQLPGFAAGPRYEGMRMRSSLFFSPTLAGVPCPTNPDLNAGLVGVSNTECFNTQDTLSLSPFQREFTVTCYYDRRTIIDQLVALNLTDKVVPMEMTAYSNFTGRAFHGTAYLKVTKSSAASSFDISSASANLIGSAPNPFNPLTQIKFSVAKAGTYTIRVYNVQGALVKTLANQRYDVGTHEATWDGRTTAGGKAASGVYYAKISGEGTDGSTLRLVMAK
jgi:flagellar hook capping protein FlgD